MSRRNMQFLTIEMDDGGVVDVEWKIESGRMGELKYQSELKRAPKSCDLWGQQVLLP
jgi:hypothetical protein